MPTTNARRHVVPAGADQSVNRATIFESFGNSIRDVVPVANVTERTQLVVDLTAKGQAPSATKPLVVHRADARGLHRIEYTTNGSVWLPASGTPDFASKAAADSFGSANPGLLTVGDRCYAAGVYYRWSGSGWYGMSARMRRNPDTPKTITNTTINQSLSATNLWVEDWRDAGIAAYNDGWTIPFPGEWEIDFGGIFSGAADLYISVNKAALASFADLSGHAHGALGAASVGMPQGFKRLRLQANDVVRLFGASVSASATWDTTTSASWFGIRFAGD